MSDELVKRIAEKWCEKYHVGNLYGVRTACESAIREALLEVSVVITKQAHTEWGLVRSEALEEAARIIREQAK